MAASFARRLLLTGILPALLVAAGCSHGGNPFRLEVEIASPGDVTLLTGESASFLADITGGTGAYDVAWTFDGAAPPSSARNPGDVVFDAPGTYLVVCEAEDAMGNRDDDTVTVTVKDLIASILSPPDHVTATTGTAVDFQGDVRGGVAPYAYAWDFDGGAPASAVEDPGPVTFYAARTYHVTFTVTDGAALSDTAAIAVDVVPASSLRSRAEIKAYWNAIKPTSTTVTFTTAPVLAVNDTAEEGVLEHALVEEGVAWVNFYRWLAGLPDDVVEDTVWTTRCQKGSHVLAMLEINGDPYTSPHDPPLPSGASGSYESDIYGGPALLGSNTGGWIACASGNIFRGWGGSAYTPAATVDGYMDDYGNDTTLGHRRWILYPRLGKTAFGTVAGGGVWASVMYVVERPNFTNPAPAFDFVAYPSPGCYPMQCFTGPQALWSFSANGSRYDFDALTQAQVVRGSDATDLGVTTQVKTPGYGITPTIGFDPGEANQDETYTVTVRDIYDIDGDRRIDYTYSVTFFDLEE